MTTTYRGVCLSRTLIGSTGRVARVPVTRIAIASEGNVEATAGVMTSRSGRTTTLTLTTNEMPRTVSIVEGSVAIMLNKIDGLRLRTAIQLAQRSEGLRARLDRPTNELLYWLATELDGAHYGQ